MKSIQVFLFILALVLSGCCSTDARIAVQTPQSAQRLIGTWEVAGFDVRVVISQSGHRYRIKSWDEKNGERFCLSQMRWDGHRLTGSFYLPSTRYTTYSALTFTDPDRLAGPWGGDSASSRGNEIWIRRK